MRNCIGASLPTPDSLPGGYRGCDNVLLDQSVVQHTYRNARGTISHDHADALVKSNRDRFRLVPTQDYVKDIDY